MKKITKLILLLCCSLMAVNAQAQLFSEDFETGLGAFSNDVGNTTDWAAATDLFHDGAQSVHNAYTASNSNILFQTDAIDLTAATNPQLSFWQIAKLEGNYDDAVVEISTNGGTTFSAIPESVYLGGGVLYEDGTFNEDSYAQWGTSTETPTNDWWKHEFFDLSNYQTDSVVIRFRLDSDGSGQRAGWYLDQVEIIEVNCPYPTGLVTSNATDDSIDLSWTSMGSETEWEVVYGAPGFDPETEGTTVQDDDGTLGVTIEGLTAETNYEFYVKAICGADDESIFAGPGSFYTGYCEFEGTNDTYYTEDFTTSGAEANISNTGSGYSPNGYEDATDMVVSQYAGGTIDFTVVPSGTSTHGVNVWVDWNNNFEFEASEKVYASGTYVGSPVNGSFDVPAGTANGDYRLRVVALYIGTNPEPCGTTSYGEAEDYTVTVVDPPSCVKPVDLVVENATFTTADVSWTPIGTETEWEIVYGAPGFDPDTEGTTIQDTDGTIGETITGLTEETQYEIYVRAICSASENSTWAGPISFFTGYCEYEGTGDTHYIDDFTTSEGEANISNTGSGYSPNGYNNATDMFVSQYAGGTIDFTVIPSGTSTHGVNVWVDWNNNFEFEESEQVYSTGGYAGTPINGSFDVPAGTANGDYRLRVIAQYIGSDPEPCGSSAYGEAEDYTVTVVDPPSCVKPTDLLVENITAFTADVSWTPLGTETEWVIIYGEAGFDPETEGTTIEDTDGTVGETITGLDSDTEYEFYVKAICSDTDESVYAGPGPFTTEISCPQPIDPVVDVVTDTTAEVSWTPGASETEWEIVYGDPGFDPDTEGTTVQDTDGTPGETITGLTAETEYEFYVKSICSDTDESSWTGPTTIFTGYCQFEGTTSAYYINDFTTSQGEANIDNTGSGYSPDGYNDATDMFVSQYAGGTIDFTLNNAGGSSFGVNVWVDWNNNQIFEESEKVFTSGGYIGSPVNGSFDVPVGTVNGDYRLRVVALYIGSDPAPCGTTTYGEAEDYTVTVVDPPSCVKPVELEATNVTLSTADLTWTPIGTETEWEVIYGPAGFDLETEGTTVQVTGGTPETSITGLNPTTFYEFYVKAICEGDDESVYAGPQTFTTPIANNDCADAAVAAVNDDYFCEQTTFGTLVGATFSDVPLTCGGGSTTANDVWFSFTASSTTHMITLLNENQTQTDDDFLGLDQAIYEGDDCDNLTEIFCNSDFMVAGPGVTRSPSVTATDLTIGETYFLRVYGSVDNPISFNVCITTPIYTENEACADVAPFCAPTDTSGNPEPLIFPSGYTFETVEFAEIGPYYYCSGFPGEVELPNPAWYYLQVQTDGDLEFEILQNTAFNSDGDPVGKTLDVDFTSWGPFDDIEACGQLTETNQVFGEWEVPYDGCDYSPEPVETFAINGAVAGEIYVVVISNFDQNPGYISIKQTNFEETNAGTTDCTITDTTIYACEGNDVTFTSQFPDGIAYVWYEYDEDTDTYVLLTDIPDDQDFLTVSEAGSYKLVSYDQTATPSEEVFNLVYSPNPELDIDQDGVADDLSTPLTYSICNASSVDLDATPLNSSEFASFTYEWVDEDGNVVATTPTYSTSTIGEFTVTVSGEIMDEEGNAVGSFCPVSETVIVESANFTVELGGDQVFCDVADYTITADVIGADPAEATYVWENANGDEISTDQSVTVAASGDYTVTVVVNECPVTETVQVTFNESPVIELGEDQSTCSLSTLVLDATPSNMDAADVTYSWTYEGTEIPETGATVNAVDHGYGSYTVTAYGDSIDCASSDTVAIIERDDISVTLTVNDNDGLFCIGETAILTAEPVNASASELTFTWYEDGTAISDENGSTLTVEIADGFSAATYAVEVTLGDCFANAEQELGTYEGGCDIPQGISPDVSVGINDCLDLSFLSDRTGIASFKLYNRYGRLVFDQGNYVDTWCGQDKDGNKLKTGTYYYVMELDGNDSVFGSSKKGWIYVNREAN